MRKAASGPCCTTRARAELTPSSERGPDGPARAPGNPIQPGNGGRRGGDRDFRLDAPRLPPDDRGRGPVRGHLRDHRHRLHPDLRGDGQAEPRLRGHRPRRRLPELGGRHPDPPSGPGGLRGRRGLRGGLRLPRLPLQLPVHPARGAPRLAPRDDRDAALPRGGHRPRDGGDAPALSRALRRRHDRVGGFRDAGRPAVRLLPLRARDRVPALRPLSDEARHGDPGGRAAAGRGPALRHERAGHQLDHVHHRGGHRGDRRRHGRSIGRGSCRRSSPCRSP